MLWRWVGEDERCETIIISRWLSGSRGDLRLDGYFGFGLVNGGRSTMSNRIARPPYRATGKIQFGTRCRSTASLSRITFSARNTVPCCSAAPPDSLCACSGTQAERPSDNRPNSSSRRICNNEIRHFTFILWLTKKKSILCLSFVNCGAGCPHKIVIVLMSRAVTP